MKMYISFVATSNNPHPRLLPDHLSSDLPHVSSGGSPQKVTAPATAAPLLLPFSDDATATRVVVCDQGGEGGGGSCG